MTPEERQLIAGLFDRMRQFGTPEKDRDAETLIRQSVQQLPDAPYMLVQSVIVQEHALQQADLRIRELEDRVRQLETEGTRQPAQAGSFLGGLFGGGAGPRPAAPSQPAGSGSVPAAGRRMSPDEPPRSGPIGAPPAGPFGRAQPGAPGGGFLQSAVATAAGVAGGMMLASSISSLLGGGSTAHAAGGQPAASGGQQPQTPATEPEQAQQQDAADEDAGADETDLQEADYETDADDWGGGDLDI